MKTKDFTFHEPFQSFSEKKLPNGFIVEDNSIFTHHHVRTENKTFYITCRGNNFFLKTPELRTFKYDISLGFHNVEGNAGFRIICGYDKKTRVGYVLDFDFEGPETIHAVFSSICRQVTKPIAEKNIAYDSYVERMNLSLTCDGQSLTAQILNGNVSFDLPEEYNSGLLGIAFTGRVGELAVHDILVTSEDSIDREILSDKKTVTIPLRNGGNIPYTLTYSIERSGGMTYLNYSLQGGPQDREKYPDYPRNTDQYTVEKDIIQSPFICLYNSENGKCLGKYTLYDGEFTVTDPGLHWKVLRSYFNIIDLPLEGVAVVDEMAEIGNLDISFGYEKMMAGGYNMQAEKNVEFVFDFANGRLKYEGKARGIDHIDVTSDSPGTLELIPKTVYDYDSVIHHIKTNHFFDESESPAFRVSVITEKDPRFISVKAELLDVYGDYINEMSAEVSDTGYTFTNPPLPTGVYRLKITAYYGGRSFIERELVFEVYDHEGKKCAPLESGLPFLYSMPNEQRYLDRDAFDMYNPVPDCNMEHYYACSSMTGDIGIKKRIWETNRLFGRKWYVWDGDHRTLTKEEFEKYGEEILRQSDYCYYPTPSEWAVIRQDPILPNGINTPGMIRHLRAFLEENPQFNVIGMTEETQSINQDQLDKLLTVCIKEWLEYANRVVCEEIAEQNVWLRSVNPDVKRACYGPFPIYYGPMTTHHGINYIGTNHAQALTNDIFDGFAQLEDYPYSCAYNTYKGAGFVMHTLLHNPGLTIYPEEYTSSRGGCIDGAVKDAHPPLGKYDMKEYFNVTHSYEYVYNTAHLTESGFRYWDTYGFMQRDFTESFVDAFIKGWKNVVNHKPKCPIRSISYLSEVSLDEDKWMVSGLGQWISNRSNVGLSYTYKTARTCGLPNGFAVSKESVMQLSRDLTDLLVIPSMKYLPAEVTDKVRALYNEGVSLLSVGDVSGLEDIFGISPAACTKTVCRLISADGRSEYIHPDTAEFYYVPDDTADILLWAECEDGSRYPAIIRKGNACLVNASIDRPGHRSYENHPLFISENISPLFRTVMSDVMNDLSDPAAYSDNGGITLFEDEHGNTLMLIIDYSDYDLASGDRVWTSTVRFRTDEFADAEVLYGTSPSLLKENGILKGVSLELHQQECALLKLIRNP